MTKPLGMRGGRRWGGGGHCKPLSNEGPRLLQSGLRHTRGKTNTPRLVCKSRWMVKPMWLRGCERAPSWDCSPSSDGLFLFTASFISVHVSASSPTSPTGRQLNHMGLNCKYGWHHTHGQLSNAFNVKCTTSAAFVFPTKLWSKWGNMSTPAWISLLSVTRHFICLG